MSTAAPRPRLPHSATPPTSRTRLRGIVLAFAVALTGGSMLAEASAQSGNRGRSARDRADDLESIIADLDSRDVDLVATALRRLENEVSRESARTIEAALSRALSADVSLRLSRRLRSLVSLELSEIEDRVAQFSTVRRDIRRLVERRAARDPSSEGNDTSSEGEERDASEIEQLRSLRSERETLRLAIRLDAEWILERGIWALLPLDEQARRRPARDETTARFREHVRDTLLEELRRQFPSAPAPSSVSRPLLRALAPAIDDLQSNDPDGWSSVRELLVDEAIESLDDLSQIAREESRRRLLAFADVATSALRARVENQKSARAETDLRLHEFRVPAGFEFRSTIPVVRYPELRPHERVRMIHRLETVRADDATPILSSWIEIESEIPVQVEIAAALARLGDPRGAQFLDRIGLEGTLALQRVSQRVLLLEAIHLRESGEFDRALAELERLAERFPDEPRIHYEIGFTALVARKLDLSVQGFLESLRIDPENDLAHYNLACAYALSGRKSQALTEIQLAIEDGYRDADHARQDTDLELLWEDPVFLRLLSEIPTD